MYNKPLKGNQFYERILSVVRDLKAVECPEDARWLLNHGSATSIYILCQRANWDLSQFLSVARSLTKKHAGADRIDLVEPKTDEEKWSWTLWRLLQLDIFLFFMLVRSLMDELCKYVLKPFVKTDEAGIQDSFKSLLSNLENEKSGKRQLYLAHREFFDSIQDKHGKFMKMVKGPRDSFMHFSTQITLKYENRTLYYGIVSKSDVVKKQLRGRNWRAIEELNDVLDLAATIFEVSLAYLKKLIISNSA